MENTLVGYRFHPTGEELINYYLKNKILGKSWLVDHRIREIKICGYEPMLLPSLSLIKSDDLVWYFLSPKEYTSSKKNLTKRTTPSGFWKPTGNDREVKEERRRNGRVIGIKKTLVYHKGKAATAVRTPWVMHEYHITSLPLDKRNYVICQVMYKGDGGDISYGNNNSNELSQYSMVSDPSTSSALEVNHPGEEDFNGFFVDDLLNTTNEHGDPSLFNANSILSGNYPYENDYLHDIPELILHEHYNDHRPKKPLTGTIYYSSDSDAESISETSYRGTSSPGDSDGNADECKDSCKNKETSAGAFINGKARESHLTRRTIPSKQEVQSCSYVKEGKSKAIDASTDKKSESMVKIEKKGWFITEEAMHRNHKSPPYTYLVNMIIGFILLVTVIGNIISVLLSVKT